MLFRSIIHPELFLGPRREFLKNQLKPLAGAGKAKLVTDPLLAKETQDTKRLQLRLRSPEFLEILLLLRHNLDHDALSRKFGRIEIRMMQSIQVSVSGKRAFSREYFVEDSNQQIYFFFAQTDCLPYSLARLLNDYLKLEASVETLEMILLEDDQVKLFLHSEMECVSNSDIQLGSTLLPQHEDKLQWDWDELEEMETVVFTKTKPYLYAAVKGLESSSPTPGGDARFILIGVSKNLLFSPRCFIARISSYPCPTEPPIVGEKDQVSFPFSLGPVDLSIT